MSNIIRSLRQPAQHLLLLVVLATTTRLSHHQVSAQSLRAAHGDNEELLVERDLLNVQTRVVGGDVVNDLDKHPFFAEWHGQFCGGALIHDDLVLTAAHCNNAGGIARAVYFRNIRRRQSGSVVRTITEHKAHPLFDAKVSSRDHDYLLLKLDSSALVDDLGNPTGVQTIALNADPRIPAAGDNLWGVGFGQTGEDVPGMSNVLRDVTIQSAPNEICEAQYTEYFDEGYMFCSGVEDGGKDTCQGDSGGPIVHQDTGLLVGIVSFGIGCARDNFFGVNSKISFAMDWLNEAKCEYSNYPLCGGTVTPTDPPMTAPTAVTPNGTGTGSLTVTFVLDNYPEELAWRMSKEGGETLHFQPYHSLTIPDATTTKTFDNLEEGETYQFKVSDMEGDGICCVFGQGEITIRDNVQGVDVWSSRGDFGRYHEVDLEILPTTGHAQVRGRSGQYMPSSWSELEEMMAPEDEPGWPGAFPTETAFTLMINVDTDDYPEENEWELQHQDPDTELWTLVDQWDGITAGLRTLESKEITNLERGWYRFVVRDSEGDGNCCDYGNGFVSLTGPLAVTQGENGLVWGNDGKFWAMDEIFFEMNNFGYISLVSFQGV